MESKSDWKRRLKAGALALTILVGSYLITGEYSVALTKESVFEKKEEKLEELGISLGMKAADDRLLILYYALKNIHLTPEQKNSAYSLATMLQENPYVDITTASKAMVNLRVSRQEKPGHFKETVQAYFSRFLDEIVLFMDDTKGELLIHELIHSIFFNSKTENLPDYLLEGVTELLVNEYYAEDPYFENRSYIFEIHIMKILCEICGSDEVLKTYTTGDTSGMDQKLTEVFGDKANELKILIENLYVKYKERHPITKEEVEEITMILDEYFYNIETEDKWIIVGRYRYYKDIIKCLAEENPYETAIDYIYSHKKIEYPYFSKELKEQLKSTENQKEYSYSFSN